MNVVSSQTSFALHLTRIASVSANVGQPGGCHRDLCGRRLGVTAGALLRLVMIRILMLISNKTCREGRYNALDSLLRRTLTGCFASPVPASVHSFYV
ncbi:hypothetical protein TGRUB_244950 [Toxoplasma gondii RUB]|uniref:Uncharacterized protein n=7 Tax=Toxoplasma gondii TaxID=5811 RepID=S7VNU8_TOXGG|nr:hypothetical protein TGGT1_244950 [Toxoplasma gondii GT1]KFG29182.1 hypothetical protein TGDOM2_244950 [Toxoplasma gondii GAB2-2007-GAL-DOM2]KFG31365.1 hypothetical protein TGFOU_244950 [Toxoplasma gondii FOU]KFG56611.1 hypothetical protein TGRUB_244950 [Toxoplasma gondii RUB]KFG99292.1 hypothetical protein TGVAND_244950 [Toxoplasma gondii VAND]KFH00408.1 hypothetical protein TGMAS_244950 [Toxoplasma gondii MAS]PUA83310.1 hypothetical protein TGBR9_244950 [Toxoplasma gondii TgCATBr9]